TLSPTDSLSADAVPHNGIQVDAQRIWESAIGDLRITEVASVGYDPLNDVIFIGNQDNGQASQVRAVTPKAPTTPVVSGAPGVKFKFADGNPATITLTVGMWEY